MVDLCIFVASIVYFREESNFLQSGKTWKCTEETAEICYTLHYKNFYSTVVVAKYTLLAAFLNITTPMQLEIQTIAKTIHCSVPYRQYKCTEFPHPHCFCNSSLISYMHRTNMVCLNEVLKHWVGGQWCLFLSRGRFWKMRQSTLDVKWVSR